MSQPYRFAACGIYTHPDPEHAPVEITEENQVVSIDSVMAARCVYRGDAVLVTDELEEDASEEEPEASEEEEESVEKSPDEGGEKANGFLSDMFGKSSASD